MFNLQVKLILSSFGSLGNGELFLNKQDQISQFCCTEKSNSYGRVITLKVDYSGDQRSGVTKRTTASFHPSKSPNNLRPIKKEGLLVLLWLR